MNLADMRRQYSEMGISKSQLDPDPIIEFGKWFRIAVETCEQDWMESNAMTIATSDKAGNVSCRTVLLKGYTEEGFLFFTCYDSQKGKQLAENHRAALLFYWGHLSQQVRIEGSVSKTSREISEQYFHSRPRASQLSAAVSAQSNIIDSREELEQRVADLESSLAGKPVPVPANWGGYLLRPDYFEFWQGRLNRLHDRLIYERLEEDWKIKRIQP
jgi:pyridoxamine 5'-phosphate oxidase